MITISLLGMDSYLAIELTKKLHKGLVSIYRCNEDDLIFYAPQSFLIHDGFEQTSFRLNVTIEAPEEYEELENDIKDFLFENLGDTAIHTRILFRYFEPEHEYLNIDESYPLYMNDSNTIKADDHDDEIDETNEEDEEEYEEPYMGDIIGEFDKYIQKHPDATNQEVYEALSGIREEVTKKNQK